MEPGNRFIWDEWITSFVMGQVAAESELSGIISTLKGETIENNSMCLSSRRLWVFRRMRRLWKRTRWADHMDLGKVLKVPERHKGNVSLILPLSMYNSIKKVNREEAFIRWSWVRGVFGVSGSLYLPKRGYYFMFRISDPLILEGVEDHLIKNSFSVAKRDRPGVVELIIRDRQNIMNLMSGMGLSGVASKLEEKALIRSVRDSTNRLVNCDASNIRKSLIAARKQLSIALFITSNDLASTLSDELQELIEVRIATPSANLSELASSLSCPVSKSTVKYRWKKLKEIAELHGFSE